MGGSGRPELALTDEVRAQILEGLAAGGSLRSLAAERGMPCQATLYDWLPEQPDFAAQVAGASDGREGW